MKKMFTLHSRSTSRWMLLLLLLVVGVTNTLAQNVTVHPGNGSMIATRKTGGGDTFFNWGGFSTWKHNQLALTMTTGDSNNNLTNASNQLMASGQLANHANDIFSTGGTGTKYLQLCKGRDMNTYMTIALPKGYRITGYTITFHRISQPYGAQSSWNNPIDDYDYYASFGETNSSFTYRTTTNSTTQNMTSYRGLIPQSNTDQYTIGRTSQTETDMGNVLYFKLGTQNRNGVANTAGSRAFIQFDHLEIFFTAEADYAPVTPTTSVTERSAVDISFTTSKINYGALTPQTDGGAARISYVGTVTDLDANLTLYEDGSVERVTDNGFDGTAGDIVKYQSGSISSAGNYFKLEGSKHGKLTGEGEAIYYIETPIWVTSGTGTNAHRDPVGYRIVGATIDYAAGTDHTYYPATFYIRYESKGHGEGQDGIYGLNYYSGEYNWNHQTVWRIDEQGYIFWGTSAQMYYLAVGDDGKINVVTEKPSADAGTFKVVDGKICRMNYTGQYIGWEEKVATIIDDDGNEQIVYEEDEDGNPTDVPKIIRSAVITESEANMSYYDEVTPAGGGTTGKYTLRIYDPTGTEVIEERVVEGTGGSINVSDYTDVPYNNDAIKIGIIGTGLINGHLTLQALDPYIDHIDIVCQEKDNTNGGKLTQQFNATDFSVRGGKFTFYVPEDFDFPVKFTFENLYSKYGDETYYDETSSKNHARYFFLGSEYALSADNVYDRDNSADYTTKVACSKPGNEPYTFNNAATVGTSGGNYVEYPFSTTLYANAGGEFTDFEFSQTEMTNGTSKTAYLFTCDEPRYNIAPTTAIQHVYYAYYVMTIDMKKKTYQPIFNWEPVYEKDHTFYNANNSYNTDDMWGLKVTTESVTDDQGKHSGYVTVSQIKNALTTTYGIVQNIGKELTVDNSKFDINEDEKIDKKDLVDAGLLEDETKPLPPTKSDQILYIDALDLMNIVENQTTSGQTTTTHTLSELKDGLAANALIYLPYGSTSSEDNYAYNTIAQYGQAPIFRGAGNIVLTDKNPFFAKYNIQVDAAKSATYTRQITKSTYTDETYATVILPFEIKLENGQHADDYGTLEFLQMNTNNATADDYNYIGKAVFFSKTNAEKVEANTPYALNVVENKGKDGVFTVNQTGAVILATPADAKSGNSLFSATAITSTGNLTDKDGNVNSYSFSHKGSFSGFKIPKASPKTFYFANGGFYSSVELKDAYKTVDLLPFRSVYEVTSPGSAKVGFMYFVEGENNTTGIVDIEKKNYSGIAAGDGTITITAGAAGTYRIFSAAGQNANTVVLKAGETRTVNVPAGVYVVNGVKVLVK